MSVLPVHTCTLHSLWPDLYYLSLSTDPLEVQRDTTTSQLLGCYMYLVLPCLLISKYHLISFKGQVFDCDKHIYALIKFRASNK